MIPKLRNISYEMRLKECGLTTLETRRLRGDQIEVFKILNGYENIDRNIFFTVKEERRTRGHLVSWLPWRTLPYLRYNSRLYRRIDTVVPTKWRFVSAPVMIGLPAF